MSENRVTRLEKTRTNILQQSRKVGSIQIHVDRLEKNVDGIILANDLDQTTIYSLEKDFRQICMMIVLVLENMEAESRKIEKEFKDLKANFKTECIEKISSKSNLASKQTLETLGEIGMLVVGIATGGIADLYRAGKIISNAVNGDSKFEEACKQCADGLCDLQSKMDDIKLRAHTAFIRIRDRDSQLMKSMDCKKLEDFVNLNEAGDLKDEEQLDLIWTQWGNKSGQYSFVFDDDGKICETKY